MWEELIYCNALDLKGPEEEKAGGCELGIMLIIEMLKKPNNHIF